jgi:hypothetical protein
MSSRGGSKGLLIRIIAIAILGGAAIVIVSNLKSPLTISESEVRQMVQKHELIGLTLDQAAKKLQHSSPGTTDGTVMFDFDQVKGWRAGSLAVDVVNGKVTAASLVARTFESGGSSGPANGGSDVR